MANSKQGSMKFKPARIAFPRCPHCRMKPLNHFGSEVTCPVCDWDSIEVLHNLAWLDGLIADPCFIT